ncbi:MAG: FAD-binding protein, partial [Alphaproteobacteria bacterium]|nr:FAD-binding protein [Alphaproteobacteria bacterium]
VDPIDQPIPVRPTCHYTMGGIRTDKMGQSIALKGLFAAGEAACVSVHGANRLGANSLLETIVFGKITGKDMVDFVQNREGKDGVATDGTHAVAKVSARIAALKGRPKEGGVRQSSIRETLMNEMQENCSVFRDEERLSKAWAAVQTAKANLKKVYIDDKSDAFNTDLITAMELENLVLMAEATVATAIERKESRGAHSRLDFPTRDDENWMVHITAGVDQATGGVTLGRDAVRTTGNPQYAPAERKY